MPTTDDHVDWYDLVEKEKKEEREQATAAAAATSSVEIKDRSITNASMNSETSGGGGVSDSRRTAGVKTDKPTRASRSNAAKSADREYTRDERGVAQRHGFPLRRTIDREVVEHRDGRLFFDLLHNDRNPNIVFVGLTYSDDRVLVMCLKNRHATRRHAFDTYGNHRGRRDEASPATALARFVIDNNDSEHELVLVSSDGLLCDTKIVDLLFPYTKETGTDNICDYCFETAEFTTIAAGSKTRYETIGGERNYNRVYACTRHARLVPATAWYCYAPMIADVSAVERKEEQRNVTLRILNWRLPNSNRKLVTGHLSLYYDPLYSTKSAGVAVLHDAICDRSHGGSQTDRLACLLQPA